MKSYFFGLAALMLVVFSLLANTYILRQPQAYEHVVKGAHFESLISPERLKEALDVEHRLVLKTVIDEVLREKTGHDRINKLQTLSRVSFEVPKYDDVDTIFKKIDLHLFILTKKTVNVFDQLLPSVNILHNYFELLDNLTTGENKKIMHKLHVLFRSSLLAMAQEVYAQAEFDRQHRNPVEAGEFLNIAQALVYRLKETDPDAMKLYTKIDAVQPVPFSDELEQLGVLARGGLR